MEALRPTTWGLPSSVVVRESILAGRALYASEDISAGSVVLRDIPSILRIERKFRRFVCRCCLQRRPMSSHAEEAVELPRLCSSCGDASYCSLECEERHKPIHATECFLAKKNVAASSISKSERVCIEAASSVAASILFNDLETTERLFSLTEPLKSGGKRNGDSRITRDSKAAALKVHAWVSAGLQDSLSPRITPEALASALAKMTLNNVGIHDEYGDKVRDLLL